jgi:sugar lactone lactonase YvrE
LAGYCTTLARTNPEAALKTYRDLGYPFRIDNTGMRYLMAAFPPETDFLNIAANEIGEDDKTLAKANRAVLLENWGGNRPREAAQYVLENTATVHAGQLGAGPGGGFWKVRIDGGPSAGVGCRHMNDPKALEILPVGGVRAQWGEGPVWWDGVLYFVDIEGRRVHAHDPASGIERHWDVGRRVGTVVPRAGGGLVIAGDDGFAFLDPESGAVSLIHDPEAGVEENRFNDGKCSPDGRFFAGTISLVKKTGGARLYRLDPDLSVYEAYAPVTNSNGIAWSPDGATVYYIDTPRREIMAFDYAVDGELRNPRVVVCTAAIDASPDGMAADADGRLWVAFCHGGCVVCYDPDDGGREVRRIDFPCVETTACAFGGADLSDLYVTTGVHKSLVEADAGRLFVVRGLGVRGLAANAFGG